MKITKIAAPANAYLQLLCAWILVLSTQTTIFANATVTQKANPKADAIESKAGPSSAAAAPKKKIRSLTNVRNVEDYLFGGEDDAANEEDDEMMRALFESMSTKSEGKEKKKHQKRKLRSLINVQNVEDRRFVGEGHAANEEEDEMMRSLFGSMSTKSEGKKKKKSNKRKLRLLTNARNVEEHLFGGEGDVANEEDDEMMRVLFGSMSTKSEGNNKKKHPKRKLQSLTNVRNVEEHLFGDEGDVANKEDDEMMRVLFGSMST